MVKTGDTGINRRSPVTKLNSLIKLKLVTKDQKEIKDYLVIQVTRDLLEIQLTKVSLGIQPDKGIVGDKGLTGETVTKTRRDQGVL